MTRLATLASVALMATALPALADFQPVRDESTFRTLVEGRDLTRFGVRLQVLPQGRISGRGFGRTLEFGQSGDPYNCQLVLRNGDTLRFISDQGTGDFADLRLR